MKPPYPKQHSLFTVVVLRTIRLKDVKPKKEPVEIFTLVALLKKALLIHQHGPSNHTTGGFIQKNTGQKWLQFSLNAYKKTHS